MATRDEVFNQFEARMFEASLRLTVAQLNVLRLNVGLAPIGYQQALDELNAVYQILPPYDWETNPPD